ncbi:MAG: hypothetical protein WDM77_10240 [Steroidobacteraceae bacterium]
MDILVILIVLLLLFGGGGGLYWGIGAGWGIGPIGLIVVVLVVAFLLNGYRGRTRSLNDRCATHAPGVGPARDRLCSGCGIPFVPTPANPDNQYRLSLALGVVSSPRGAAPQNLEADTPAGEAADLGVISGSVHGLALVPGMPY